MSRSKPSRETFTAQIKALFPGATVLRADRGLKVVVGTKYIAERIELLAKEAWLVVPLKPESESEETWTVEIFGFPREKKSAYVYHPADDETLKDQLAAIRRLALLVRPRACGASRTRVEKILQLTDKCLNMLEGKDE